MTDRHLPCVPAPPQQVRSDAEAGRTLDDAPYIAYALIQAFKLFSALVCKRWPQLK